MEHWALDSGGFSELDQAGKWSIGHSQYASEVLRFREEIGPDHFDWAAPQDWMCEPWILQKTGLRLSDHQHLTTVNFVQLRELLGELVIPVLQGWELDDYLRHLEQYGEWGFDLSNEPVVGVGSVCRRQSTKEAGEIFSRLASEGLRLHGFGVKKTGLTAYQSSLISSDSMAWSFTARRNDPLPECTGHINCANCPRYAVKWRSELLEAIAA